ncbi:MAG TPA: metal ABC transporter permease [Chloroflexota bacterium]
MPGTSVQLSWNPFTDLQLLFQYHFMHNAFLAGTLIALAAGPVGYFMVLRGQAFAGHALAHVGFSGAAGALLIGVSPLIGLLVVSVAAALGISVLNNDSNDTGAGSAVAIGTVYTFFLGLGLLFLQLYSGQAENVYSILFGAVLGVSDGDVQVVVVTAAATLGGLAIMGRPLFFASIDPDVAAAQGVPVRSLGLGFLVVLAFAVAQAVQVVGVLLIFALLVAPAATAQRLTSRPGVAIGLSIALSLVFTWLGLAIAYFAPYAVVGFYITSLAFGTYVGVRLLELAGHQLAHAGNPARTRLAA